MKHIKDLFENSNPKQKYILAAVFIFIGFLLAQLTPIIVTMLLLGVFGSIGFFAYRWFSELNKKVESRDDN